jgi:PAS domain-containing protein
VALHKTDDRLWVELRQLDPEDLDHRPVGLTRDLLLDEDADGNALDRPFPAARTLNVATRQLTVSPELEAFYGLEPGTVRTYQELRARVHPDDLDRMEARHEAAIRNHQPFDIEFRIVLPSGGM